MAAKYATFSWDSTVLGTFFKFAVRSVSKTSALVSALVIVLRKIRIVR